MIPQRVGDIAPERIAMMMPPRPAARIGPMNARLSGVSKLLFGDVVNPAWIVERSVWFGMSYCDAITGACNQGWGFFILYNRGGKPDPAYTDDWCHVIAWPPPRLRRHLSLGKLPMRDWPMCKRRKTEDRENARAAPQITRNALDLGPIAIAPGADPLKLRAYRRRSCDQDPAAP